MTDIHEPDNQFVERLEWQLASEFRRVRRLKSAGKISVSRRLVAIASLAGVLTTGVAVTKAADYFKDSWRKKVEMARVDNEVRRQQIHVEFTTELAASAKDRVSTGVIQPEEYQEFKLAADKAAEVRASGGTPRNDLYAPVIAGRDYVSARLEIEKNGLELDLQSLASRLTRLDQMVKLGLAAPDEIDLARAVTAGGKAKLDKVEKRLGLRKRFVAGNLAAQEVEIADRIIAAEADLAEAQTSVYSQNKRLEVMQQREALGLISIASVREARHGLEAAEAAVRLATMELEILKKVK